MLDLQLSPVNKHDSYPHGNLSWSTGTKYSDIIGNILISLTSTQNNLSSTPTHSSLVYKLTTK